MCQQIPDTVSDGEGDVTTNKGYHRRCYQRFMRGTEDIMSSAAEQLEVRAGTARSKFIAHQEK